MTEVIYVTKNGITREATPEQAAEILASQAALVPAPIDPLTKPLDRLAFWLVAASAGVSKWSVRDRITGMPEATPEEFRAKAEAIAWFEEAKQYRRYDPILVAQAEAEGITSEQLDALWIYAAE